MPISIHLKCCRCPFLSIQTKTRMIQKELRKHLMSSSACATRPKDFKIFTSWKELTKAWRCLENESTRQKCLDIVEEAEAIVTKRTEERKKQLKREGKDTRVDEDDPEKLKRAVYVQTMKLFADMERKRRQQETRDQEERKRKRDLEIEEEEQRKAEKEWQKNFEADLHASLLALDPISHRTWNALECAFTNPHEVMWVLHSSLFSKACVDGGFKQMGRDASSSIEMSLVLPG
ncbi:dnaJ homolog subfamily C member 8 isoform X5 [Cherax quadricarinatus]|uniref:dnaJ homolog subfamily C member 8 isoform X5 n=1 Tax=Cherax quadricarinatus TaxID=27406 RepID=UPI0023796E8D|nr:dnaJ homolog subfamily C member 8-like isoform X5 [Cherax quadricarinatus]XP_053653539.1 dnaJ homolog subfamily C member 8-like isoform X5 [Cherax quadricarinatus]